jgi:hypothetical protein
MKFTIQGFSQAALVEHGLDCIDALIIRWVADFIHTGKMATREHLGKVFQWVKYQGVLNDLPILGLGSTDAVARRFRKIVKAGIFEHFTLKKGGVFAYYRISESGISVLLDDDLPTLKSEPSDPKVGYPSDPKVGTNNSSTKINPSTKRKEGFADKEKHHHGEFNNVLLTDIELEKLKIKFGGHWDMILKEFSTSKAAKGYKYVSDYAAFSKWDFTNTMKIPLPDKIIICPHCGQREYDHICRNAECPQYTKGKHGAN